MLRSIIRRTANRAGYDIVRRHVGDDFDDGWSSVSRMESRYGRLPGMISTARGVSHYLLAYGQTVQGDVVEIGVWQGRNTCFLAAACRDTGNGVVHAIDHFRGNPGRESRYRVGEADLSDLEASCRRNIEEAGLTPWVHLHVADAAEVEIEGPLRMLLIDGEHSYDAVMRDARRFGPMVTPGGLVVFDDYSPSFPQVVQAAQEWASVHGATTPVRVGDGLVVRVK